MDDTHRRPRRAGRRARRRPRAPGVRGALLGHPFLDFPLERDARARRGARSGRPIRRTCASSAAGPTRCAGARRRAARYFASRRSCRTATTRSGCARGPEVRVLQPRPLPCGAVLVRADAVGGYTVAVFRLTERLGEGGEQGGDASPGAAAGTAFAIRGPRPHHPVAAPARGAAQGQHAGDARARRPGGLDRLVAPRARARPRPDRAPPPVLDHRAAGGRSRGHPQQRDQQAHDADHHENDADGAEIDAATRPSPRT